eukprot:5365986-Pleurochrysis_carterae.AAC.1
MRPMRRPCWLCVQHRVKAFIFLFIAAASSSPLEVISTSTLRPGEGVLPSVEANAFFGCSLAPLWDMQIAVGAQGSQSSCGRIFFIELHENGTASRVAGTVGKEQLPLEETAFPAQFGFAMTSIVADADAATVQLAASTPSLNTVYLLTLDDKLALLNYSTIKLGVDIITPAYTAVPGPRGNKGSFFGQALASLPDIDGDGYDELVIGAGATEEHGGALQ